jgi:hypothetical protein
MLAGCAHGAARAPERPARRPSALLLRAEAPVAEAAERTAAALQIAFTVRGVPVVPRGPAAAISGEAQRVIDDAEARFFALEPAAAAEGARRALAAIEEGGLGDVDRASLLRAILLLAQSELALDHGEAADRALDRALAVDPSLELDPARYSPVLRARLSGRRRARGEAWTTLRVEGAPAGAVLRVDGGPPVSAAQPLRVAPGRHVLRVDAEGYEGETRAVMLGGALGVERFALERTPRSVQALAGPPGRPLRDAARAASAARGWSVWVLDAAPSRGLVVYRLFRPDDGLWFELAAARGAGPAELARALLEGWEARAAARREEARARRRRRAIGWAGGAAAAIATAAVLGTQLPDERPTRWRGTGSIGDAE